MVILFYYTDSWFYCGMAINKNFISLAPGVNVKQLYTVVIHHHFMVLLTFCCMKTYYHGNYHVMAVYYQGKRFYNIVANLPWYWSNLSWYFKPRKCRHCSKIQWYFYNFGHRGWSHLKKHLIFFVSYTLTQLKLKILKCSSSHYNVWMNTKNMC